jgi:ABC-type multidrug transport system fused ATPase/permease subunit
VCKHNHNLQALHVVAEVPQEPFLFAASIHDNIAYGLRAQRRPPSLP